MSRVRKLADAHEKAARRVEDLAAKAAALESFDDPADVSKLLRARADLDAARIERDALAVALEGAQRAEKAEAEAQAARELEARQKRDRAAAEALGSEITEALESLGQLIGRHETLVEALPAVDRYRLWPPTYAETASRNLCPPGGAVREIGVRLLIPK